MTRLAQTLLVLLLALTMPACELIGDIFQAGLVIGIILIVLIVAIIMWIVRKVRGPRRP